MTLIKAHVDENQRTNDHFGFVLQLRNNSRNFHPMPGPIIPIAINLKSNVNADILIMSADIGGTKTHIALFKIKDGQPELLREKKYRSKDWHRFSDIVRDFQDPAMKASILSLAVAGPVQGNSVKLTNLDWTLDHEQLRRDTGIGEVVLMNDLEANAYGLAVLPPTDFRQVYAATQNLEGNAAVIAPGTGLGEAGFYWDGEAFHPFATEGGHEDFAPRDDLDIELYRFLRDKFGHVSWERVISGPGIFNIYQFLRDVKGYPEPDALRTKLEQGDPAQVISDSVAEFPICNKAICLFIKYLAVESSNLALNFKATGGLFIGGGIIPKIWNESLQNIFLEHFFEVGRLRPLTEAVPVYIILNPTTALLGAAYFGASGKDQHYVK